MARPKKETLDQTETKEPMEKPSIHSVEWTDYVLSLLEEDEKIKGNPTTDGLRRIFEVALDCVVVAADSDVVQAPSPENEKRATVVHKLSYVLNNETTPEESKYRSVSGTADVYWGNCDKIYRNHPVAVAETRAEGRALRRGLKLKKVVAAEEIAENIEDHPDSDTVSKITNNQINFIDVLGKRLDIDIIKLLDKLAYSNDNIYNIEHSQAIEVSKLLSSYQQNIASIPEDIKGYYSNWK